MELFILPIILTIAGSYFLFHNLNMIQNEDKLIQYLESNPKGRMWVHRYGIEKTLDLTKKAFLPLGIMAAIIMLGFGIFTLIQVL